MGHSVFSYVLALVALALATGCHAEYQGKNVEQWILQFKSADPQARDEALMAIRHLGPAARKALPALLTEPFHFREPTTFYVTAELGFRPDHGKGQFVAYSEVDKRSEAIKSVINPRSEDDLAALMSALRLGGGQRAAGIVMPLELLGATIPSDFDPVRRTVGLVIPVFGSRAAPALTDALGELQDPEVVFWILDTLKKLGTDGSEAVPLVKTFLQHDDQRVSAQAEETLKALTTSREALQAERLAERQRAVSLEGNAQQLQQQATKLSQAGDGSRATEMYEKAAETYGTAAEIWERLENHFAASLAEKSESARCRGSARSRGLYVHALALVQKESFLEALASLEVARFECGSPEEQKTISLFIIDVKQKAGQPLTLSERQLLSKESPPD